MKSFQVVLCEIDQENNFQVRTKLFYTPVYILLILEVL